MGGDSGFGALGLGARLKEPPAPELVRSHQLETDDCAILWRETSLADLAHMVMLIEVGVLPIDTGRRLLGLLCSSSTRRRSAMSSSTRCSAMSTATARAG